MEIFLLIVVILLIVIFNLIKNDRIVQLEQKLSNIEKLLKSIQLNQPQQQESIKEKTAPVTPTESTIISVKAEPVIPVVEKKEQPIIEEKTEPLIVEPIQQFVQPEIHQQETPKVVIKPSVPSENWYDRFRKNNPDWEKFIGENILSKVAITVLVLGVAFFVKYAIDQNWINEIARVGIGILCGGIVLGFAHRLHKQFKAFSSVLVAGGISIFYFTIGIAFHEYHLFNQTVAFIIMLFITGFSVFISILYDRVELAALSLIGGFATPFMVSTGQGNYVALFVYLLILDLGMLVLAYLRKWNLINILAYAFTVILYFSWLQAKVIGQENAPYKGALIFAGIFYVVFVLMNIINNIKERRKFGVLDLSILISNTFIFYAFGMQILSYYHPELQGAFSGLMAAFNLVCSWLLYKKFKADTKLVYLMIGLTLTFVTLIAPVQLHGNYITVFWALESVLLIWLAQKSGIVMYRFASVIITALMIVSLFMDWANVYDNYYEVPLKVMLNKGFITGMVSALSMLGVVWLLKNETEKVEYLRIPFNPKIYSSIITVVFLVVLYLTGFTELAYQIDERIYFGVTIAIIMGAYHFMFFAGLNLLSKFFNSKIGQIVLYIFNFFNAAIFVIAFALLPINDFRENMYVVGRGYEGFIMHYTSLFAVIYGVYCMYKVVRTENSPIKNTKVLNSVLVALALTYVCSAELVLHVLQIIVDPVVISNDESVYLKAVEYDDTILHVLKIGFPILWGLLAFAYLFLGMKKQNKTLRIGALVLIAITLLKLFIFDIKDASEAGKIVAFIILGVVLLVISFMYQKIKKLLLDDENKEQVQS